MDLAGPLSHTQPRISGKEVTQVARTSFLIALFSTGIVLFAPLAPLASRAEDLPLLFVTQDESQVEKQIGAYLGDVKGLNVTYRNRGENNEDKFLGVSFNADEAPSITMIIDTSPSANRDGQASERRVKIYSYFTYGIKENHPKRAKVLEVLNLFMTESWSPGRLYLDSDGDVILQSDVNIPGQDYPVHPEMVYDLMSRMVLSWKELYPALVSAGVKPRK
jgi:hypothetical protein